ncbi:hypothetical protein sos41_33800 [Alphaproteobacteria bacterium SO-S41]|nr:hypothetical protein sos41_33800 [Alphaproteobacteria bacterium SO-S41]
MKFALLIYDDEVTHANASPEARNAVYAEHMRLGSALREKAARLAGEELTSTTTAKTVQTGGGQSVLTDGPFAETAEHLTGFYLIEAASLDEAVEYAKMLSGTVEVRAVIPH